MNQQSIPALLDAAEPDGQLADGLVRAFILAGRATFTVENPETRARFTYRVTGRTPHGELRDTWEVELLHGPDNERDFAHAGTLERGADGTVRYRPAHRGLSARAFWWLWHRLEAGRALAPAIVWHAGRCGRCGRTLTVPESIATGLGPVCAGLS